MVLPPCVSFFFPQEVYFYFFIYFFFFLLYDIVLVLPYISMNPPQVYTCSQSWTFLPPPSPYHLSGSSQCTSTKHPVSCIEPRLAICFSYDIIHVSMPFSQIIPPSPSPTESKRQFYTSVSLKSQLIWTEGEIWIMPVWFQRPSSVFYHPKKNSVH